MVDVKRIQEGNYDLITIVGEVDASSSIELDNAIAEAIQSGNKAFLVDCSSLEYISSAGLGVFMSYIEDFKKNDIHIVLFGMNEKVRNVFEILGLDQLLTIRGEKEEAKSAL
ncbi:STAS domain-containing protein [Fulvivirga lutimaris]|uniref:STAS domain-containing protein n=1 Tax=Fulvivirga lutimaris TaxID=1819566 RepID=UPI0012BBBD01|nr:STAS domain-containing protein [Fulvivirga lutimaris]MTI39810.1 anti-sigma factor antagonist [Fulvivirga lutimaris]